MIVARSPLRISLAGGATDLKSFYRQHGGMCISAAIDKYVYVLINRPMEESIILKYSELEHVKTIDEIKNPIIRECLKMFDFKTPQIEIVTCADIPSSTGLGGSSSFTCALLKGLSAHRHTTITPERLAALACDIEIEKLNGNLGKQDQTISAHGGIQRMYFNEDDSVNVEKLKISYDKMMELQESLLLFFTGYTHRTNDVLKDQVEKTQKGDSQMIENLLRVREMAVTAQGMLEGGDIIGYGHLTHEHWINKRKRSLGMSNAKIDEWYDLAMANGAIGGKLVGAGGAGGFLLFVSRDPKSLRRAMARAGLEEVKIKFDFEGTKIL